jgi:hypothetical protein
MARWQQITNGNPGPLVDTDLGQGITTNGTWYLLQQNLDKYRPITLSASVKVAGHTGTLQFVSQTPSGAAANLDTALIPVNGTPVVWPNEYSLEGDRALVITGINGTVYPWVGQ